MNETCNIDVLKFDSVEMDTKLAEEYLRQNPESLSRECIDEAAEAAVLSLYENKIYSLDSSILNVSSHKKPITDKMRKLINLAKILKTKEDLFAQLNYKLRNVPMEETKIHMDLIIKQLKYWSLNTDCQNNGNTLLTTQHVFVPERSGLVGLGTVAYGLTYYSEVIIYTTQKMTVFCHLFSAFCHEAGFTNVSFQLLRQIPSLSEDPINRGCVAVISERSDWESALDVFFSSSNISPWRLTQIFVQESIYEDVKRVLKWTCKKILNERNKGLEMYECGANEFLLDAFGAEVDDEVIRIDAYRTTKEALSLVKTIKPGFVSLWASDVNEANEVAHEVNAEVVWVNDFGSFDGPSEISLAVFHNNYLKYKKCDVVNRELISQRREAWTKLSFEERQQKLLVSLENYDKDDECHDLVDLLKFTLKIAAKDVLVATKNTVFIGIRKPVGMLYVKEEAKEYISKSVASLLYGNAIVIEPNIYVKYKAAFDLILQTDAPVCIEKGIEKVDKNENTDLKAVVCQSGCFTAMKAICFNYSTIFAN